MRVSSPRGSNLSTVSSVLSRVMPNRSFCLKRKKWYRRIWGCLCLHFSLTSPFSSAPLCWKPFMKASCVEKAANCPRIHCVTQVKVAVCLLVEENWYAPVSLSISSVPVGNSSCLTCRVDVDLAATHSSNLAASQILSLAKVAVRNKYMSVVMTVPP